MRKSELAQVEVLASSKNYSDRRGMKVCKFTPHHMAGNLTVEQCGRLFQNPNRGASANYGIGTDGRIAIYVDEDYRGWTSSNAMNDRQAITVEVANCEIGGQWKVSDAAWESLVKLAYDVCKRYNFRLTYDGTPNGSLTHHNMFAKTTCPGPYLQSRMKELAETVNRMLDEGKEPVKPSQAEQKTEQLKSIEEVAREVINGKWGNGADRFNRLDAAGYNSSEVQKKVNEILLGKGSSNPAKKSIEQLANEVIKGLWGNGADRKNRLTNAGYNYSEVQKLVNKKLS